MTYIGQEIPSLTNTKLAAGRGTFVDDISLPGMTHAAVLRSPYAHARIRSIDATRGREPPRRAAASSPARRSSAT